jgi:hypothetical protein
MNRAGGVYIPTPQKTPQTASPTFNNNTRWAQLTLPITTLIKQ